LKSYTIKHKGTVITLETDHNKPKTLDAILRTIFHEYQKSKPNKLDELMKAFNAYYNHLLIKEAVKEGRYNPKEEAEIDTFDFWRRMMETPPGAS
jgi:hypothetical protein